MNERIKETANEILANLINKPEWDRPCTEKILESFAKLIVKECANIANAGIDPDEDYLIGDDILKHFGVE